MAKFSIKDRIMSFTHAYRGLQVLLKSEHNAWIHLALSIIAVTMGLYLHISNHEWIAIIICIGMVLAAEIFNTAIEHIANFVQPHQDLRIKMIKDLGAAGVFMTAISALIVGLIIFLPKIMA